MFYFKALKPEVLDSFSDQYIHPNNYVSMKCLVSGNPIPVVSWFLYNQPIRESNNRVIIDHVINNDNEAISYLNISRTTVEDGGIYTCKASNKFGMAASSAKLEVYGNLKLNLSYCMI